MTLTYQLASNTWSNAEEQAIQDIIKSGHYTMGERVKIFEKEYATWTGSKYALMCNSGSSANLLAVSSLFYKKNNPLKPGDEVIVPAMSWSTTYFPLTQYGLKLVFVDVDADTLNLDLTQLKNAITDKTRLIFTVNLLGNSNKFDTLNSIIANKNIYLLEDNCESMGATYKGQKTGTFGLIGTQSTFFSHHMATMEGGLCITDDEELYQIMLCMRAHGWLRDLPEKNLVCNKLGDAFLDSFRFALPGYCLRPTEIQGALGSVQLKKLDAGIQARRNNAAEFSARFSHQKDLRFQKEIGKSSWFGFSMLVEKNAPFTREEFVKILQNHGVECRPIVAGDFTQNPVIQHLNYRIHGSLKNAKTFHSNGVFVGNNPENLSTQFDILEKAIQSITARAAA